MIKIKRAYDKPDGSDGARYLVDRLWPRGVSKASLDLKAWLKDVAPSASLRRWFNHDLEKWSEFRRRYFAELEANPDGWKPLAGAARKTTVTLVYSVHDPEHNNAIALAEFLAKRIDKGGAKAGS